MHSIWLHMIAPDCHATLYLQPSSAIFMLWELAMSAMSAMSAMRPDDMRWMPATSPAGCYWANGRWSRSEPRRPNEDLQKIPEDPWRSPGTFGKHENTMDGTPFCLEYVGKRGGEQMWMMWTVSTCLYFEHLWAFAYRHPEPLPLPSDVEVT